MASTMRYGSGKEVGAVIFNVKEQKYLQKSMHTLDIEQNYSLKLLELDHRVLRVNHQKLKDRVNRIKSNLTPDDIIELRQLEEKGQLKPSSNSVNIGSAMKIAAASRRLNLNGSKLLARSANVSSQRSRLHGNSLETGNDGCSRLQGDGSETGNDGRSRLQGDSSETGNERRSHFQSYNLDTGNDGCSAAAKTKVNPSISVIEPPISARVRPEEYGHGGPGENSDKREDFSSPRPKLSPRKPSTPRINNEPEIDRKEEDSDEVPNNLKSATRNYSSKLSNGKTSPVWHPLSARDAVDATRSKHPRPLTTAANGRTRHTVTPRRPQTHHGTSTHSQVNAPFSSHSIAEKDQRQETPRDPLLRKRLSIVDDSLDSNFGENLYEERRMNMLRMETIHSVILAKKKEAFLQEMDEYIDEAKNVSFSKQISVDSQDGEGGKRINSASRGRVEFIQPGDIYKSRLLNLWKGLNKCRYLRVPDNVIDLSGIKTLARDQFQLNSLWQRYTDSPH